MKVNLYYHEPGNFLGFIPILRNRWQHLPSCLLTEAPEIITLFFARDITGLSNFIERAKSRG